MKLRLVEIKKEYYLLCSNGSILRADEAVLCRLLHSFNRPNTFKGNDGYWNNTVPDMEDAPGKTVAFVDDMYRLIVLNAGIYSFINKKDVTYVSAIEYAELQGKSWPAVKKMCAAGRVEGAYKISSGWLIPKDAPWPERKIREVKKKEE